MIQDPTAPRPDIVENGSARSCQTNAAAARAGGEAADVRAAHRTTGPARLFAASAAVDNRVTLAV